MLGLLKERFNAQGLADQRGMLSQVNFTAKCLQEKNGTKIQNSQVILLATAMMKQNDLPGR